jgi:hypothetical protein
MWAQFDRILRQAAGQMADHVANFLPGVLVALMLLVVALLVASVARVLLLRLLRGLDFDRHAESLGLSVLAGSTPASSASMTTARIAYWAILLLGLLVSLTALNATIPAQLAISVFQYVPHLAAALIILLAGAIAARFLARSVLIGAVNMQIQSARFLSLLVKWLVLLVTIAMALDHLGIGRSILLMAFGILFGGIVLAGALAVGLGARDVVSRTLARQLQTPPRRDDTVDHI